jgi:hypothetical protein
MNFSSDGTVIKNNIRVLYVVVCYYNSESKFSKPIYASRVFDDAKKFKDFREKEQIVKCEELYSICEVPFSERENPE